MKNLMIALLALGSISAFADCSILAKHDLNYTILDELKESLPASVNLKLEGDADFGIADSKGSIDTGRIDVFGTQVKAVTHTYQIFEQGKVVFKTKPYQFSSDVKTLRPQLEAAAKEISDAFEKLGCK